MANQPINLGTAPLGEDGDTVRAAFEKVNSNTSELYGSKLDNTDPRLSDAREWTAATVTQAEAEAGTATTRRAWTAQRVRQAIVAWWNGSGAKTQLDAASSGITSLQASKLDATANAVSAGKLATARTIGGVAFDGTANINLPGVNAAGTQATTGNAATATALQTAHTINGVSFNGTANITVADATKQGSHANLSALSGLTGVADRLPYFTGAGALSLTTLTGLARNLLDDTTQSGMQSTLGLVKQTSVIDTTAGALMGVGAFGLGGTSTAQMPSIGDANATAATGFYRLESPFTNGPTATTYTIINTQHGSTIQQIAITTVVTTRAYIRSFAASTWGAWAEVITGAKQTSPTDTTAGALMSVGAFGLGTDSQPTNIDPNTVRYGSVMSSVSQPNAPSTACVIWSGGRSAGARSAQLAIDHASPARAWIRGYNSGRVGAEWAPWTELWTSAGANAITVDTGSIGYGTGSGGTVTQATSKSTEVTLNKPSGQITTAAGALAANTAVSFTLTNNKIAANDIPRIVIKSGAAGGAYVATVDAVAAGSCRVSIRNMTAGSLSETLVLQFNIEKGAIA